MATLVAKWDATQTDQVQQKVGMQIVIKALTEAANATPSASRALANEVLSNPVSARIKFTFGVIANLDAVNPGDASIATAVNTIWPYYALGYAAL